MPLQGQRRLPVAAQEGRSLVPRACSSGVGWLRVTAATTSRFTSARCPRISSMHTFQFFSVTLEISASPLSMRHLVFVTSVRLPQRWLR